MSFSPQFSSIKGISERRRLPRLGKIRLGVKAVSSKNGKEYPKETDYFVCPMEVEKVYGPQPKELRVMLPLDQREAVFPQAYKWYGNSRGLKCIGNGEIARRGQEDGTTIEISCPCEHLKSDTNPKGECTRRASLMVMLPDVPGGMGGVYQIDTSSIHSIIDINSGIDMICAMNQVHFGRPRIAMLPLKLVRTARETHGSGKKEQHYTMQLLLDMSIKDLAALKAEYRPTKAIDYVMPLIDETNPERDPDARVIIVDEEDISTGVTTDERAELERQAKEAGVELLPQGQEHPEFNEQESLKRDQALAEQDKTVVKANGKKNVEQAILPGQKASPANLNKVESMIKEANQNRMVFVQFMVDAGYIDIVNDRPDIRTLKEVDARHIIDNWKATMARYNGWNKTQGPR